MCEAKRKFVEFVKFVASFSGVNFSPGGTVRKLLLLFGSLLLVYASLRILLDTVFRSDPRLERILCRYLLLCSDERLLEKAEEQLTQGGAESLEQAVANFQVALRRNPPGGPPIVLEVRQQNQRHRLDRWSVPCPTDTGERSEPRAEKAVGRRQSAVGSSALFPLLPSAFCFFQGFALAHPRLRYG